MLLKSLAGLCEEDVALVALEQAGSNFIFERLDLNTQRWLRYVKTLGRAVEAALICNHYKVFKLA